jgi:chemotaxis response regulator CheB
MKIGIVNDLPMAAEALRRAITLNPLDQVVWIARDGAQAVALCASDRPELVLMDLVMPGMDGVEATRRIMSDTPCPILVVTSSVGANASRVFDAMGHGALDAVDTPSFDAGDPRAGSAALRAKIDAIRGLVSGKADAPGTGARSGVAAPSAQRLVAIGASAGGPAALAQLLAALPSDFQAALVIVQHVDERFAAGMADWLSQQSRLPVQVAAEGDRPGKGRVLLAGTNDHLTFKSADRLGYTADPEDYVYRPSVDVFFHSICRYWPGEVAGVLLTGMGNDGAQGLKALRDKGHHTIAQDQASSAVYGMPKAAAAAGAAADILSIEQIAPRLVQAWPRRN